MFYAAAGASTYLAEVFEHTRRIDRVHDAPWLVIFTLRKPIVLTDRAAAKGALPPHPQFNLALADDLLLDVLKHAAADLGYGLR